VPQSLAKILVHVIFSTKNQEAVIPQEIRSPLQAYISGILENLRCPSLQTGGTADHVHTLLSLARTQSVAEVVEEVKRHVPRALPWADEWLPHRGARLRSARPPSRSLFTVLLG
jgi:REP element-mobilizing transposase RayT